MENAAYVFSGRIHPERAGIWIRWEGTFGVFGQGATPIEIHAKGSQILIQTLDGGGDDLPTLRNRVTELAQQFCDSVTWGVGEAYRVEIVSAVTPEGPVFFSVGHPTAARSADEAKREQGRAVAVLTSRDPLVQRQFARALADYRQSILESSDTAELCWRAVEALSYTFERNNKKGMAELAIRLRIDRDWILRVLERPAGELRHGKVVAVTAESRDLALSCAQAVIDRFTLLRESGLESLGETVPLLDGI